METLGGVLKGAPSGDYILLGDFNAYVGKDSETWWEVIWRNNLLNLNSSGASLLDFCADHSVEIAGLVGNKGSGDRHAKLKVALLFSLNLLFRTTL